MTTASNILRTATPKPKKVDRRQPCSRCGGSGVYRPFGTCYRCSGAGTDPTLAKVWAFPHDWSDDQIATWIADKEEADRRATERRLAKKQADREARLAADPVLSEIGKAIDGPGYVSGLAITIFDRAVRGLAISGKQRAVLDREIVAIRERADKRDALDAEIANADPVPVGRVTITGEVVMRKAYHSEYGTTMKLIVKGDAGWRVFVTEPSTIFTSVGDRVTMVCTVTASDDDPSFGYGKRPSKAVLLDSDGSPIVDDPYGDLDDSGDSCDWDI